MKFVLCVILLPLVTSSRLTQWENRELRKTCGKHFLDDFHFKVIGGREVLPEEYPWLITINNEGGKPLCTGVVISSRHILTAAHCIIDVPRNARTPEACRGHRNMRKPRTQQTWISDKRECPVPHDDERCKMHQVKVRKVYPGYNECTYENDLAVLEMFSDLPRKHLAPICMPTQWEKLSRVLQAAGSGNTIPTSRGHKTNGYNVVNTILKNEGSNEIKTKTPKDAGVCDGDSGGPLFQRNIYGKQTLVGVYSRGYNCTEHGKAGPDIITDVRKFLPWICNVTGVCYTLHDEERAGIGIWFTSQETFVTFERHFGDELSESPE